MFVVGGVDGGGFVLQLHSMIVSVQVVQRVVARVCAVCWLSSICCIRCCAVGFV